MIGPVIEDGCVAVDDGVIAAVGHAREVLARLTAGSETVELGDVIMTPGFVNAHAHLELTCYRNTLPKGLLGPWIEKLIALRLEPEAAARERTAVTQGAAEMLSAGITCVGDISRTGMSAVELAESPIRKVCFIELISGARMPPKDGNSLRRVFEEMKRLEVADRLVCGISPHAPHTVNEADFKSAAILASKWNAPFTIHYLETPEESANRVAGCHASVVELLEQVRPLPAVSLAHVNYPSSVDLSRIATSGASVIWCPRAHSFYGHRSHPWRDMLARGINVALGTDSAGCVPTLSILDEIREAHRLSPTVEPIKLLQMATLNGARALGMGDRLGALEAGRLADFAVFRLHDSSERAVNRLLLPETKIVKTIIGGEVVIENGVD